MQIYAIQSNELIPINANGREYKILIDKKVVPQSSIAFANYHFDKSVAGSLHYHETETEVYYCLKGKGWIIRRKIHFRTWECDLYTSGCKTSNFQ